MHIDIAANREGKSDGLGPSASETEAEPSGHDLATFFGHSSGARWAAARPAYGGPSPSHDQFADCALVPTHVSW